MIETLIILMLNYAQPINVEPELYKGIPKTRKKEARCKALGGEWDRETKSCKYT